MRLSTVAVLALLPLSACDWGFVAPWSDYDDSWEAWDTAGAWGGGEYEQYLRGTPQGMEQSASMWIPVNGLAFQSNGLRGVAGMASMACRFESATGYVDIDLDPDYDDEETVQDGEDDGGGLVIVSSTRDAVQLIDFRDSGGGVTQTYSVSGVVDARLTDDGVVALRQGADCTVVRLGSGDTQTVGSDCAGFDVAADGRAFVVADGTVSIAHPSGAITETGTPAELMAWDPVLEHLYTAIQGSDTVSAVTTGGTVVWSVTLDGRVSALDAMGDLGQVLVGLSVGSEGRLLVLDGATGGVTAQADAYQAPDALWASDERGVFAARTAFNTHLLRLTE